MFNAQALWQRVARPFLFTLWAWLPISSSGTKFVARPGQHEYFGRVRCGEAGTRQEVDDVGSSQKLAMELNESAARGDWRDVFTRHQVLESLTMEDMHVKRFFVRERATVGMMGDIEMTPKVVARSYSMTSAGLQGGLMTSKEYTRRRRNIKAPGKNTCV